MRDLRYILIYIIIIIFSGLSIYYSKEGLDCAEGDGSCKQNPNNIYVVIFLIMLIVWLVIFTRET